jgi:hypothetical protein
MNELLLKEFSGERVVYLYKPEGKGEAGEVVYSFATKDAKVVKKAEEDATGRYGHNATRRIRECVEEKHNLPIHTIQAWS